MKRGGVVDAVAEKSHDVLARLQRLNQTLLMRWGEAGEDRRFFGHVRELLFRHCLDVAAEDDSIRREAYVLTDFACHELVVTREHFDRHAVFLERFERGLGGLFRWIEECDVA